MLLTKDTKGYFNNAVFQKFQSVNFINVGRGTCVITKSLKQALIKGHIYKAYHDVFEEEPLDKESDLWTNPRIYITPHIAAFTNTDEAVKAITNTYIKILKNETSDNKVDLSLGY